MSLFLDNRPRARLVVTDDHLLTRAGIRALLADDPDFELIGEAINGGEVIALSRAMRPDLVLMDVRMPDMDGLEATRRVRQVSPTTQVLILSMFEEADLLIAAVRAGAAGYVLKGTSEAALRGAISEALAGNFPVDRHMVRDVLKRVAASESTAVASAHTEVLSARELQVVELLARGLTNREIAEALVITPSTVKVHVEHILAKLGVSDRTQAAVQAIELGLIRLEPPSAPPRSAWQTPVGSPDACSP